MRRQAVTSLIWPVCACRACGRPGKAGHYIYQDPGEPEEILCVPCARWRRAWLLGLVEAADKIARWGQFRSETDVGLIRNQWGI